MAAISTVWSVSVVFLALLVSPLPCHDVPEYQKPVMVQETGTVLPKPQMMTVSSDAFTLSMSNFEFTYGSSSAMCDVVYEAFQRYYELIFTPVRSKKAPRVPRKAKALSELTGLQVTVKQPCEGAYPSLETSENYTLTVAGPTGMLMADTAFGALRGLETFSQLVYRTEDGTNLINKTTVSDFPRFAHRGILLDTSRHFVPKKFLLQNLDAMAYNKFNVFHWHIVDDPSFPYQSIVFPELSEKGAFNPYTHLYTQEDVKEIIEYARLRGIRVIPEFDTPGHTQSWGAGLPGYLTPCYDGTTPNGRYYAANPILNTTYDYMTKLLQEVKTVFPDKYIHLGGDEVNFNCWKSNPDITKFMKTMGFGTDYSKLEQYYIKKILDISTSVGRDYIVWQEVLDNGVQVAEDTVVEVWKSNPAVSKEMASVTSKGLRAILSSCWYLNYISYGSDWGKYYTCDPQDFDGASFSVMCSCQDLSTVGEVWFEHPTIQAVLERLTAKGHRVLLSAGWYLNHQDKSAIGQVWKDFGESSARTELRRLTAKGYRVLLSAGWYLDHEVYNPGTDWSTFYFTDPQFFYGTQAQKDLVIGGEACMWGEYVDGTNLIARLWPRAGAVAERLWSAQDVKDVADAGVRLNEQRCRMVWRGLNAEPFGPGFCQFEYE